MNQLYQHHCQHCKFFTSLENKDFYHCEEHGMLPLLILRYGNEDSQYRIGVSPSEYFDENLKETLRKCWNPSKTFFEKIKVFLADLGYRESAVANDYSFFTFFPKERISFLPGIEFEYEEKYNRVFVNLGNIASESEKRTHIALKATFCFYDQQERLKETIKEMAYLSELCAKNPYEKEKL